MTRWRTVASALVLAAAVAGIWRLRVYVPPGPATGGDPQRTTILGVEDLMQNAQPLLGHVRVKGVVTRTAPKQQLFSLADLSDLEEVRARGGTQCPTLPVRWPGQLPAPQAIVVVEGIVDESQGKLFLAAVTVKEKGPDPSNSEEQ